MKYHSEITLKNGKKCIIRSATKEDAATMADVFNVTHAQTDFLLSTPEECDLTADDEANYLQEKLDSDNTVELLAEVDGVSAGSAGVDAVGNKFKLKHRAEFGISVLKEYWGLGIGRALTNAAVECAKKAGYEQLELNVVSENEAALSLYKSVGFVEYGRNPKGFRSPLTGWQELVSMRLELN